MNHRLHQSIAILLCGAFFAPLHAAEPANLLPNGNFEPAAGSEPGKGWVFPEKGWQEKHGLTAGILASGETPPANHWLGLTARAADTACTASCTIALPPGTRRVRVSGRFRIDQITVAAEPKWAGAFIGGAVLDATGKKLGSIPTGFRLTAPTGGWVKKEGTLELAEGAAQLQLQPGLFHASGDFAVDDLELTVLPPK